MSDAAFSFWNITWFFKRDYTNLTSACFKLKFNMDLSCKFCSKRLKSIKFFLVSQNRKVLEGINPNKESQTVTSRQLKKRIKLY